MKHIAICSLFALMATLSCNRNASSAIGETIAGSDPRITYTGRVALDDTSARFDWSGVKASVKFKGTSLNVRIIDSGNNYFNVWVDREPAAKADKVITTSGECTLSLASSLPSGEHTVILQKRTEGEQGTVTVCSFTTDGTFLQAQGRKERNLEFVGDSYTCGFGTEGKKGDPFEVSTENCNLAYSAIIGRFFDADIHTVCHSGRGLVRNYGDGESPVMTQRYKSAFDECDTIPYNPGGFRPDAVVVYLGTNDFSCGSHPSIDKWCDGIRNLLSTIRSFYGPDVPVLCVSSRADRALADYVEEGVRRCEDDNVHWTSIESGIHNDSSDLGSVDHPNYEGQRKVAFQMIPYISTITGWEMPVRSVE